MVFPLTWSTENSDSEGTLPVRGVDRLHHSQCLLTNPIDHAPTTSYSTLCLHWTPWPQTVPDFKSETVFEGFEIENDCEALAGLH